jgi:[ribosomal protein S18]-alanine N-acetyltransferase
MTIRLATAEDIPVLLTIERESLSASHWSAEKYQQIFSHSSPSRIALVKSEVGKIQGFLVARTLGDEWELENIAVSLPARRQGIGTLLLQELLNRAKREKASKILLEVRQSNLEARSLYRKFGFQESGVRAGYYQFPDESAITYRICLQ